MTGPNCGTQNAPRAKFCSDCGTPLADTPALREDHEVGAAAYARRAERLLAASA